MKIRSIRIFTKILILVMALTVVLNGCESYEILDSGNHIYRVNTAYTTLVTEPFPNYEELTLEGMLTHLYEGNMSEGYMAPLYGISLISYEVNDEKLVLEFGREYLALTGAKEILVRAAIVKSLVQIPGIDRIEFRIGKETLKDVNGNNVGFMDEGTFVDYSAREQARLFSEDMVLYYVSNTNDSLVREKTLAYFDGTVSREQTVIKYMLQSPVNNNAKIAISKDINIINIQTNNGVCYLDMDMSFYDQNMGIPQNLCVQAIVNSLCELEEVRSVQINIIDQSLDKLSDQSLNPSGTYEYDESVIAN